MKIALIAVLAGGLVGLLGDSSPGDVSSPAAREGREVKPVRCSMEINGQRVPPAPGSAAGVWFYAVDGAQALFNGHGAVPESWRLTLSLKAGDEARLLLDRGDRREDIFLDDVDRAGFYQNFGRSLPENRLANPCLLPDCLMPNHFHLVVETPQANLVADMSWLLSTYTLRLNHRHQLCGHVFSGRYKSLLVEGSGNG